MNRSIREGIGIGLLILVAGAAGPHPRVALAQTASVASLHVAPASGPTAAPQNYTGERISLNLKDVDLKDFFRLIHEVSGLNVIVDPNITGTLTLVLDNVPWDQALDIVLKNNGLGKVLEGNVLRIARVDTLTSEAEANKKLQDAQSESAPLVTVIRVLKYARAIDTQPATSSGSSGGGGGFGGGQLQAVPGVATIIKNMGAAALTARGTVVPDPRNNAVIITDVQAQIPKIETIIDKLDTKSKQVQIEAKIVLATTDFVRSLQSSLNNGLMNSSSSVVSGGATGSGASAQSNVPGATPPPPRITIGQTGATGFGAYALSNLGARYFIGAAIAAAETRNEAKVISAPTIVTQNNVPGEVLQGTQIPVQTSINNTISTIYLNATLTLDVLPQMTDDSHIFLNIRVQNNSPGQVIPGTQNPEINTQAATTQVLVMDGGTVVFGGIKVSSTTKAVQQVPGLGSIPVIGNLFKSSNREVQENQLLFIVTPKVLAD